MTGYGWCDVCRQPPGLRCIRLSYLRGIGNEHSRKWESFYIKGVHRGRARLERAERG